MIDPPISEPVAAAFNVTPSRELSSIPKTFVTSSLDAVAIPLSKLELALLAPDTESYICLRYASPAGLDLIVKSGDLPAAAIPPLYLGIFFTFFFIIT
jgi:hypothetical protein